MGRYLGYYQGLYGYGSALSVAYLRFLVTIIALFPEIKILKIDSIIKKKGWLTVFGAGVFMALYGLIFLQVYNTLLYRIVMVTRLPDGQVI